MGFFDKLKRGLSKTKNAIVGKIDNIIKSFRKVDEDLFEELEEALISADIGVYTTQEILDRLREIVIDKNIKESELVKNELFNILKEMKRIHTDLLKLGYQLNDKYYTFHNTYTGHDKYSPETQLGNLDP